MRGTRFQPLRVALGLACVCTIGLSACGSNDANDAEQTVRDFVTATNDRDPKLCDELVAPSFLELTTGQKGDRAIATCKKQLAASKGRRALRFSLRSIQKTTVDGDKAKVRAVLEVNGGPQAQTIELKKQDGKFRITGAQSFSG